MNRTAVATALAVVLVTATEAAGQQRWAFELRTGAQVSTRDVEEDELGTGFGLDGTLRYRFSSHLGGYAGWDWVRFGPDDSFAGQNTDLEETGYALGLRWEHPFEGEDPAAEGLAYWLRAGGIYDHVEVEDADGEIIADSGHGLGWEAGLGLAYWITETWSLTPGVRYRSLSREIEIGPATTTVDLQYIGFEIGVARAF